ncbi:hypothetical protein NEOLEDRAFT_218157 [Neolentinus lepideus HHB14362 ss-1]|uniref:C2H2-type domain-containing protein n=1 Tax=Neolentinus lepideus HHB14362 ss-1 TaxID=1314782 RepID=A0A165MBH0_9AGAM|nr:hypothetical protein NEOLEDRAFT_218157 [Neolentinus lepideus HHB14362 ss-1]
MLYGKASDASNGAAPTVGTLIAMGTGRRVWRAWRETSGNTSFSPLPQPLTSSLHPISPTSSLSTLSPASSAPSTPPPPDRSLSLEREFCTNFTCCGRSLSDLHELVDHFEESHVLLVGPEPTHPRYHPYKPQVVSYPNPSPSPASPDHCAILHAQSDCPGGDTNVLGLELDQVALPPRAFTVPAVTTGKSRGGKVERRRERAKRERGFRCPKDGCTKSYLNPNGLKYHLEKGTCVFEPA